MLGDAPPPPLPPPLDGFVDAPLRRKKAAVTVHIGAGHISYYPASQTHSERFEATCEDPDHNTGGQRCRLSRSVQARDLGTMAMYLGSAHMFADKAAHQDPIVIKCYLQHERLEWRQVLKDAPNGPLLISKERPPKPGEPEERAD